MKTKSTLPILLIWVLAAMNALAQPRITNQPPWLHVCRGSAATFWVGAEGTPPLSYQWYSGGVPSPSALLAGETNATLLVTNVIANRNYVVVVTNYEGSVTSAQARAYLDTPFAIAQQPVGATVETGSTFTCSATVTSQVTPSFQWHFNAQPLPGATASTLTVANVQMTNVGDYWLQISNACNCDTSQVATLKVAGPGATFTKITEGPVVTDVVTNWSEAWGDFDGDGWLDLVVLGNEAGGTNTQFFHNEGNGQFARLTNGALSNATHAAFYAAWSDVENDGDLDLLMTADREVFLYRNHGGNLFTREPAPTDVPVAGSTISCADYDGDGFLDAFLGVWLGGAPAGSRNTLLHNRGDGTFAVLTNQPMCLVDTREESSAWVDYDNDGALDLFVTTEGEGRNRLYHNNGNSNHWLKVRLKGTKSNSYGVGARVFASATIGGKTVRQMRQITAQTLCQELEAHFGLGDATNVTTLRIEWPSRHVTEISNVAPDQILTIKEPPGVKFVRWEFGDALISVTGNIGERYDLWTSSDVAATSWIPWQTVTNTNRTMTLIDPSPNAPQRFYKAVPAK